MPKNKLEDVFKSINMHGGDPSVCWEWTGELQDDRPYFQHKGRKRLAYAIVYELVRGTDPLPKGQLYRHRCDNPACCNPSHLEPGSHQQNMDDMRERGRAGLSHHVVRGIKNLLAVGRGHQEIADLYGIARETVTSYATGHRKGEVE